MTGTMSKSQIQKIFSQNEAYLSLIIVAYSILVTSLNPSFLSFENLLDLGKSSASLGILAIGVFIVLLSGGIDMSFTAIAISGQYISANVLIASGVDNIYFAFLISCIVGLGLGAINGLIISYFKIPTFIVTLGTLNVFHGILLTVVGTKAVNSAQLPDCFKKFGATNVFTLVKPEGGSYGLSIFTVIFIAIALLTWFILTYTQLGRGIYAIGGDMEAAKRAGLNVFTIQFFIYCYVGILAGIAGVLHVSLIRYSNPTYLVGTELSVIAPVVLGGTRITGGSGTIIGTLLGVAMITLLNKSLILIGLSSFWQEFFTGVIVAISVSLSSYQIRKNMMI
ncbi:MAG: ABC transporter permease [Candidatus Atribacteria bacterium]|nr:ABC transporter permease [Candidatus Atribacteria bacterium]